MLTKGALREKLRATSEKVEGIAHVHRLSILYILSHEPMNAGAIAEALGEKENLVSHHLKGMSRAGWIQGTKKGREITYRLKEKAFLSLFRVYFDTPFGREFLTKKIKSE